MARERKGEEWVRVERRKLISERNPVRQKNPRRDETRIGEARRVGRADEHGFHRVIRASEGQIVSTFLVRNYPPECSSKELIASCQEAGPVVDLYCPRKRDVKGNRFCFVRIALANVGEEEVMLANLNSLWMDSYKLRAFIPLFGRRESKKIERSQETKVSYQAIASPNEFKVMEQPSEASTRKNTRAHGEAGVLEGASYLQVAKGCLCPC